MGSESHYLNDEVGIFDSGDTRINPSTNEKLDELKVLLAQIEDAVDELELKADNITLEASDINLNTDEVEAKLQAILTVLGEVQANPTDNTVLDRLKDLFDKIQIDGSGRILVSTQTVTPPETTEVKQTYSGAVGTTSDNFYVIPNGETLQLTQWSAGAEVEQTAGSVIELFYAPNGDTTGLEIIDKIYASGNSDQHDLNESYVGDGTKAILLRRRRLSGGSKEIFARWEGYY